METGTQKTQTQTPHKITLLPFLPETSNEILPSVNLYDNIHFYITIYVVPENNGRTA